MSQASTRSVSSKTRVLTGITTTGTPHLGNYVGAIKPAIAASQDPGVQSYYFLADLHALIKCQDPERVQESRLEIAATWLALGLDTDNAIFYRQSDIPEIPELTWMLSCVSAKGLLNRAHAYKAAVAENEAANNQDPDKGVTMGLFSYPVLMAADILMFNANKVPVGRDQIQHIEMARDIAGRFNHLFKSEFFTLPEAVVDDEVAVLNALQLPVRRNLHPAGSGNRRSFHGAAGAGRAQDVQELQQHHSTVRRREEAAQAGAQDQDQFAGTG